MTKKFRTGYEADYDPHIYGISMSSENEVQQSAKEQCDINRIVRRYTPEELAAINIHGLGDFDPEGKFLKFADYQTNMYTVADARSAFQNLPAEVRKHYKNDPVNLLAAIERKDESAYRFGFLEKEREITPEPTGGKPGA